MMPTAERINRLTGALLGTAVGDALGLPREGLSRRRAERLYGSGPIRHRFLFGRGMLSDDTEHACMTAQALLAAPEDEARFARSLALAAPGLARGDAGRGRLGHAPGHHQALARVLAGAERGVLGGKRSGDAGSDPGGGPRVPPRSAGGDGARLGAPHPPRPAR